MPTSSHHTNYFFLNEFVKKAALYQDWGSTSLLSSWFCRFGCSHINEEEKLVGLPFSMGYPLTDLPISSHQAFLFEFSGIKPRWIVEGNGACCSHSCRPPRTASSCRCLPPILICSDALLLFHRFKSREEDGLVVHHPGSLMPSSQAASLMPTFSELHIY